jgi:iron complex outermembrane receptor protein
MARTSVAFSVLAAALTVGVPQGWAQNAPAQDPTAQDQTAADPEGSVQIQSSQDTAVDRSAANQGEDTSAFVVTGTILRGAAPIGSNLISVGEDRIQSQGATTANELLATVPQASNLFNNVPAARLPTNVNQVQVVRPNLRNLAPEGASTASTLVLFDGHRMVRSASPRTRSIPTSSRQSQSSGSRW